ncbi:MAG: sensor histidine kinase [Rhizobiales bacterium]|nr:sensor histidine kinase [Hyphomicrobiales bacterium]
MKSAPRQIWLGWACRQWGAMSLAGQFLLAGAGVLLAGMLVIGFWVTRQIEDGVVRNSAAATALYVDSIIAPLFPDLEGKRILSEGARRALDETLAKGELAQRVAFFKIWVADGLVAYSSEPNLIGKSFEPTESLRQAWAGRVAAEFNSLDDPESRTEKGSGMPLLEIYSPIREPWSGKVIAVAEFYEIANELADNLAIARLRSWLVVALVTLAIFGLLSGIVLRGSILIAQQRAALEQRVGELSELLRQNEHLRQRVQAASGRATMMNERFLRRISADLHDGPAQLLALALLRMNGSSEESHRDQNLASMPTREYLEEAMRDIRSICSGLILPQIEPMGLDQLLASAASAHERRTGTHVDLRLPPDVPVLSQSEKICIYRFVQEGLSNSFRHAAGIGQSVTADMKDGKLIVSVADKGTGFDVESGSKGGIGLAGLRERVESLGGEFTIRSSSSGTSLVLGLRPSLGESG